MTDTAPASPPPLPRSADQLRAPAQRHFDDLVVGAALPERVIGPVTTTHAMRWSAAIENWHRIHYDQPFAVGHEGLPNVLIAGSWKQSLLCRYLKDLCLPAGWLWKVAFQHRAMIVPGDTITCWARVDAKELVEGLGHVRVELGMRLQTGVETCPGQATLVLPVRGGDAVPYPFVAPDRPVIPTPPA